MKKIILLGFLLSNFFGLAQDTLIPDVNFEKALISEGIDNGVPDGRVLTSKISVVTSLDVSFKTITDLTGIEDFSSLTSLSCGHNQLNFLNLNNPLLQTLICMNNKLTSLNVSKCLNLKTLWCFSNQLIILDITKNTALEFLFCGDNKLSDLDFLNNKSLIAIDCSKNQLISLDVSNNKALSSLDFNNNKLTSLDITKNNNLIHLYCHENQLNSLNLKNGTNTNFATVNFKNNPSLTCIQIDNKANSDTNWSLWKDATASFSENCNKISIAPPKITASGNQIYCPGAYLKIIPDVTIAFDPLEPETDVMYVQISSGYVAGFDLLSLANPTFHQSKFIYPDWDTATGKLKLYSPTGNKILYTDFVAALKDVIFSNNETLPSGARTFSITIGQANYLPSTQHFYEYVPSLGISWTDAKAAAESRTYFGLKGYLATIMAADEAQLTGKQSSGAGWIGGSDAATEGVWRWVTGPEGLANSGNGVVFWNGLAGGSTPNFAFWNTSEPNQFGGAQEDYVHITAPGVGITGAWNDLTITGDPNGSYQPKGYIVEYGGMPGDPILQIAASTSISIPTKVEFEPASRCFAGSIMIQPKDFTGSIRWYNASTGGPVLQISNTFTTPNINTTTSYFTDPSNGACPFNPRIEVIATVIAPTITSSSTPTPICGNGTTTLTATGSTGSVLKWYETALGGTLLATSSSYITPNLSTDTTFYVDATEGSCVTTRTPISAKVLIVPTITSSTPATRCDTGSVTLYATASAGTLNWYEMDAGGTSLRTGSPFATPSLTITTPFYVDATDAGCTSDRTKVEATITKIDTNDETVVLCPTKTVTIEAPISGLNYLWSPGGEITQSIPVSTIGNYVVNISSPIATSCGSKKTYTVIERPAPVISNIEINENSIRIFLTDPQDYYEFSIDGDLFQKSNEFNYIPTGTKTAYVRDTNSCDSDSLPFTIFSIAAYFTPNNDGINDSWLIPEMKDYPGSNVKIFNRYGKLLKQMNAGTVGWSGKFNNQDLPADDYWYVLKLDPTKPEIRGHFTLKR